MIGQAKHLFEFGPFQLDATERQLLCEGEIVALTPKVFDLLLVLVENSGHTVEKDELLKRIWPDSFVEEANLSVNMTMLRRALGENPNDHPYIETVPKRGYRFVASVKEVRDDGVEMIVQQQSTPSVTEGDAAVQHDGRVSASSQESPTASAGHTVTDREAKRRSKLSSRPALALYGLAVLVVAAAVYALLISGRPATSRPEIRSLAVLPLDNLSGDVMQDYFADGMTEALITEMSKISALRVISRRSVMQYKGNRKTMPEIARELGVDAIVEGSVQRSGERVKITMHLIRAANEQHLWADAYERDLRDVLSLQSEVARAIANQINVKLTPQEEVRLANRSINPEAFDAFLRGLEYQNQFVNEQREEPDRKALQFFEQAIKIDPDFALAYAHMTFCYGTLANRFRYRDLIPKAKEAALNAVRLDDTLAQGHGSLAFVLMNFERDCAGTEREFKRTIELNPSYGWGHWGYANYLTGAGRFEEAIAENKVAQGLEPLLLAPKANIGYIYLCMREYDRAIEQYRKALALFPNSYWLHNLIGFAYQCQGKYEEALAEYQKARDLSGDELEYRKSILGLYLMSGRRSDALKILNEFKKENWKFHDPRQVAEIYSLLGEKDKAMEWLEKGYAEHDSSMLYIRCNPELDSLSSDPRFQDLLRRMECSQ